MQSLRIPVFLLMLWLLPGPAFAFSPEGHEVVAHIAARALGPHARAAVTHLLGGDAETMMVLDASWADEVRGDRPGTAAWHYVNIEPESRAYDARRDCGNGDCVVAQIGRDELVLASRAPAAAKAEALKFLIHLVADLHQPLHVADNHDRGGNDRILRLRGQRISLHRIWDDTVVAALGRDPARVADGIWRSLSPREKRAWARGTTLDWTRESLTAARVIYAGLNGNRLAPDYAGGQRAVIRMQLAKAGLRLAAILNRLFQNAP
jgi:hypothetical protein